MFTICCSWHIRIRLLLSHIKFDLLIVLSCVSSILFICSYLRNIFLAEQVTLLITFLFNKKSVFTIIYYWLHCRFYFIFFSYMYTRIVCRSTYCEIKQNWFRHITSPPRASSNFNLPLNEQPSGVGMCWSWPVCLVWSGTDGYVCEFSTRLAWVTCV